ncbi:hypothetical protein XAP6164_3580020 [Xanthomonas phaseoli pv. phaseoli]|nr:hypothetical protein XAP6164_3580020 [Xanthomonas phaseoli pv. phaseoli]
MHSVMRGCPSPGRRATPLPPGAED